jgi:hypothetical protein
MKERRWSCSSTYYVRVLHRGPIQLLEVESRSTTHCNIKDLDDTFKQAHQVLTSQDPCLSHLFEVKRVVSRSLFEAGKSYQLRRMLSERTTSSIDCDLSFDTVTNLTTVVTAKEFAIHVLNALSITTTWNNSGI